jgi:hypothetical protein
VSPCEDSFKFGPLLGENAVTNSNAHNDALGSAHSEVADLAALLTEAHHDLAIHDLTETATLDHAMALAAHHGFLV